MTLRMVYGPERHAPVLLHRHIATLRQEEADCRPEGEQPEASDQRDEPPGAPGGSGPF